jgi:hypothetical protein
MHHKRRRVKQRRAGCMLCKPGKNSHNRTADRIKGKREALRVIEESRG